MTEEQIQAQKELEILEAMPESIKPLMEFARMSLQATVDGKPIRALDWRRLAALMIEHRPKVVYALMTHDKGVSRCIYKDGEYCDPVVSASNWDTPCISFDYRDPFECYVEVTSRDAPVVCPVWPLILITRLKGAGIKMVPMK
ncbi:TPA: hypothetical protein ACNEJR_003690 [Escherichia coli]